jgi:NAD(P)-dependent dehydrogenase (short-subunit alcohol dehydrogenase family)
MARTVIVTGANSGIGLVTARVLAAGGAHVVLAVRDRARGEHAAATIEGPTEVRELDLADLESVRAFAAAWQGPVDILINNAGVANTSARQTIDGFELQLGTNHLGHFALTNLLLPQIADRVVTVSSSAHRSGVIDLDDLNWQHRPYRPFAAYSQSKLANLLFTLELQRRLDAAGSPVRAVAAHPGIAATNLNRHLGPVAKAVAVTVGRLIAQSDRAGALPTLYAATEDVPGGSYVGPRGLGGTRGKPKIVEPSAAARDAELAGRLWTASEELTGVAFPDGLSSRSRA